MMNVDRVKKKLPSLLIDGETTNKRYRAARHRIENGLKRLKKRNAERYQSLEMRLIRDLEAIEKVISEK